MSERVHCAWDSIIDHEDEKCDQEGTLTLPGEAFYYSRSDEFYFCPKHHAAVLKMECMRYLNDNTNHWHNGLYDGKDRSTDCGAKPVVGFVIWYCESNHREPTDEEIAAYEERTGQEYRVDGEDAETGLPQDCALLGCHGFNLQAACKHCMMSPNENDLDTRRAEQLS